jgi:hypothetical protein
MAPMKGRGAHRKSGGGGSRPEGVPPGLAEKFTARAHSIADQIIVKFSSLSSVILEREAPEDLFLSVSR